MHTDQYVRNSLELHLFFGRIMKEHALFLKAGFTPADPEFSRQAECLKREFEKLLRQAVALSDGIVSCGVLRSGEVVTEFTQTAENQTEAFTGIPIDQEITRKELGLTCADDCRRDDCHRDDCRCRSMSEQMCSQVRQMNRCALDLLDELIHFKELILERVLSCQMFTMNYPLLIEHIIREAKLYRQYLQMLERDGCLAHQSMREIECFWNQIMMEHALFIRGLLDPAEGMLIQSANDFAWEYSRLLTACCEAQDMAMGASAPKACEQGSCESGTDSMETTLRFRDFKMAGVEGIEQCKIRSVILPLLADHVLREANHYLRLLQEREA